jgi:hypothetical protein
LAQCADGADNDGDGLVDYPNDPGCTSTGDNDETDAPPPPPPGGCDLHATPSNLGTVFGSATAGQTICLASGNYGTFKGGVKSGMVTLQPEDGATPSMALSFSPAQNITLDGLNITDANPIQGTSTTPTKNITIRNSTFNGSQIVFRTENLTNSNILLDHDVFANYVKCSGCYEGRVQVVGSVNTQPDGITVQNSEFYGGDGDGIQNSGNGTRILNNEFHDLYQQANSLAHTDSIQLYGSSRTVIRGNYVHNASDAIMAADGADHEVIENNVFKVDDNPYSVQLLSDNGSVFRHNTIWGGATCNFNLQCGVIYLGNKPVDPPSTGTTITDNIVTRLCVCGGSAPQNQTEDYNLVATTGGTGAHDIRGIPTYVGGSSPTTMAGFALTAVSPGHAAADDGSDMGAAISP